MASNGSNKLLRMYAQLRSSEYIDDSRLKDIVALGIKEGAVSYSEVNSVFSKKGHDTGSAAYQRVQAALFSFLALHEISVVDAVKRTSEPRVSVRGRAFDPAKAYHDEMGRFRRLTREEEVELNRELQGIKQKLIYHLCMLPQYKGSLECCLASLDSFEEEHGYSVLFGRDKTWLAPRARVAECVNTIGLINSRICELLEGHQQIRGPNKRKITRKRVHKFRLVREFDISRSFLHYQVRHLRQVYEKSRGLRNNVFSSDDARRIGVLEGLCSDYFELFNSFVSSNLRLAASIAKKHNQKHCLYASGLNLDVGQNANLGLMNALDRFDHTRGNKFSTFSTHWIRQGITRRLDDTRRVVRVPAHASEALGRIEKLDRKLRICGRPSLSTADVAKECGLSETIAVAALRMRKKNLISLDRKFTDEHDSGEFMDFIQDYRFERPDKVVMRNALRKKMKEVLEGLPEREQRIIAMRYGIGIYHSYTLEEIGILFGLTRERVRQIEEKAMRKLQHPTRSRGLEAFLESASCHSTV